MFYIILFALEINTADAREFVQYSTGQIIVFWDSFGNYILI